MSIRDLCLCPSDTMKRLTGISNIYSIEKEEITKSRSCQSCLSYVGLCVINYFRTLYLVFGKFVYSLTCVTMMMFWVNTD